MMSQGRIGLEGTFAGDPNVMNKYLCLVFATVDVVNWQATELSPGCRPRTSSCCAE